jgi:large conductance mechanosensitive channel
MKKTLQEFKAFLNKGNAIDLAIGLVMGTAFNSIIKSLVSDILTPLLSLFTGTSLTNLFLVLEGSQTFDPLTGQYIFSEGAIVLYYGKFLSSVVDFFIVALALFFTLKVLTFINKKARDVKEDVLEVTEDIKKIIKR